MHFSKTLATVATFAMSAYAAMPVASVDFQSWESCDVGAPVTGQPKFVARVTATPLTCDKTPVNPDWSIDNYSFTAKLATKDAAYCHGVIIWNNDGCSGKPTTFLPFDDSPFAVGKCLPDILDPGYVSFKLACDFPGAPF
ncbi:hypothetical protein N7499_007956 [Penicillium canescens]|uniref:Uncharacterized protein n=1 Tax=Penicillium canescens TaxID=5083 RepID=A0AAD6HY57_PENCN|nr:uncharacterized protein N7446_012993 [Penicillium canescens]KAJ5985752.1 hypothetical protein N7522_012948 [Penicillium canescens]KAJ6022642.1 hypothetical protein N7460_013037 [Penicillium canescens]KAJ6026096.1 hypothetical protein N7444_013775 [Penicillium canescens]KAJ6041927.1 hypothetical protein N7446_012993 [Penicillium canescens]KAJ6075975.1 hypothetical protein N7499_007956 [Penicillium canescens]